MSCDTKMQIPSVLLLFRYQTNLAFYFRANNGEGEVSIVSDCTFTNARYFKGISQNVVPFFPFFLILLIRRIFRNIDPYGL